MIIKKQHFYLLILINLILLLMSLRILVNQTIILDSISVPTSISSPTIEESESSVPTSIYSPTIKESESTVLEPSTQIETTKELSNLNSDKQINRSINESNIEPSESTTTPSKLRYGFTDDEIYLLAQLLCGDEKISGDGEYDFVWNDACIDGYYTEMAKVLCVVMNQQRSSEFADTVSGVILHPGHFTPMPENTNTTPSKLAISAVKNWCDAYDRYDSAVQIIPEDHLYFSSGPNNTNVTRNYWK